jgi:hypothetical protein
VEKDMDDPAPPYTRAPGGSPITKRTPALGVGVAVADRIIIAFGPEFLVLSPEEFAQARTRGRELLEPGESTRSPAPASGPSLLDADALAEATGVPARWWTDQAREHRVPHRRIGRRVRFDLAEVLACEAVARRACNGLPIRRGSASG